MLDNQAGAGAGAGYWSCKVAGAGAGAEKPEFAHLYPKRLHQLTKMAYNLNLILFEVDINFYELQT